MLCHSGCMRDRWHCNSGCASWYGGALEKKHSGYMFFPGHWFQIQSYYHASDFNYQIIILDSNPIFYNIEENNLNGWDAPGLIPHESQPSKLIDIPLTSLIYHPGLIPREIELPFHLVILDRYHIFITNQLLELPDWYPLLQARIQKIIDWYPTTNPLLL